MEMQQSQQKASKFLVSDSVLYRRQKTRELLAEESITTDKSRTTAEGVHELSGQRGKERTLPKEG